MSDPTETHGAEHFEKYLPKEGGILGQLEAEADDQGLPIIGPVVGRLLYLLVKTSNANSVLELGTCTGYSAIWMARALEPKGGNLVTVEWDPEMAERARGNIKEAGFSDTVEVVTGDAGGVLEKIEKESVDVAFIDVDKEYYIESMELTIPVLRSGGLMVFDNTAFVSGGEFLDVSWDHPDIETVHLHTFLPGHRPNFDGLSFMVKK